MHLPESLQKPTSPEERRAAFRCLHVPMCVFGGHTHPIHCTRRLAGSPHDSVSTSLADHTDVYHIKHRRGMIIPWISCFQSCSTNNDADFRQRTLEPPPYTDKVLNSTCSSWCCIHMALYSTGSNIVEIGMGHTHVTVHAHVCTRMLSFRSSPSSPFKTTSGAVHMQSCRALTNCCKKHSAQRRRRKLCTNNVPFPRYQDFETWYKPSLRFAVPPSIPGTSCCPV